MRTTVDIPDDELKDVLRFTRAKTEREAIVAAIADYNRRHRLTELVRHAGTCEDLTSPDEIQLRRGRG